ncbi:MAG: hypothetical protein ABI886_17210 [Betaproteobacteria bacterium]
MRAADRGGPFGRELAAPGAVPPRNWMRAPAPGIAAKRPAAESSPVGGGRAAFSVSSPASRRAAGAVVAAGLGLALWLAAGAAFFVTRAAPAPLAPPRAGEAMPGGATPDLSCGGRECGHYRRRSTM